MQDYSFKIVITLIKKGLLTFFYMDVNVHMIVKYFTSSKLVVNL